MESDRRFGFIIFLFRLAGIPFHIKKISIIYATYMRTVIICASLSYLGMFVDVYIHRDDLGRAMTTMRVLIPVTNVMWLYTYCRYVRTLIITVTVKQVGVKHSITVSALLKSNTCVSQKTNQENGLYSTQ
jgi:hypothetical protein